MSPLGCDDRSGFLFAHACDRPAAGACSVCGKPICTQHTRMSAQGPTCITCLHQTGVDAGTGVEGVVAGAEAVALARPSNDSVRHCV